MNTKERQIGLAKQAFDRGLIDATMLNQIAETKASHELIEVLFDLVCGEIKDLTTALRFIARMCQYSGAK